MKPKIRVRDIVVQKSGRETLIYDMLRNKAFCLNEISSLVYELCDGSRTSRQISGELGAHLKTPIGEEFVGLALSQMAEHGLIKGETFEDASVVSRRKVIKKLGVTSLIVLPSISLIIAPKAIAAQSCLADGTSIPIPFPNPSTQPDAAPCTANCFQPPNPANPEASCCSGIARSGTSTFAGGLNRCTCGSYQCVAM